MPRTLADIDEDALDGVGDASLSGAGKPGRSDREGRAAVAAARPSERLTVFRGASPALAVLPLLERQQDDLLLRQTSPVLLHERRGVRFVAVLVVGRELWRNSLLGR
ncbi:hypothetical protein ABZ570_22040 [Micromonospora sp. NPDC007271]|uniref:hypothetical protein n=1 Tax=Micromonospora sp. NPDC007271 TaxID=3154587 RepID=UPI0033C6A1FD